MPRFPTVKNSVNEIAGSTSLNSFLLSKQETNMDNMSHTDDKVVYLHIGFRKWGIFLLIRPTGDKPS